ncbi:MAG: hypothetical protein ABJC79_16110 [Acidimicrobiia bacterium]
MTVLRSLLFAFGYPVSIVVIIRFVPVVRERRTSWFVLHQLAVAAIVAGWALDAQWGSVAVNTTWFVAAAIWYVVAGRRSPPAHGREHGDLGAGLE